MYDNNDYMYAIERNPDYLAHYGIRGMKWGVRKAREMGGARGQRALSRQYAKAQKKLAKLEKRAASGKKYARRAAALGAGAAAAGGLAIAGTKGVSTLLKNNAKYAGKATSAVGNAMIGAGRAAYNLGANKIGVGLISAGQKTRNARIANSNAVYNAGMALDKWGKGKTLTRGAAVGLNRFGSKIQAQAGRSGSELVRKGAAKVGVGSWKAGSKINSANLSNNTIARIGAGAIGAGLAGAAGYNAYRAATTKRAAKKATQFRSEMNKAFRGTQYASNNNGANSASKPRQGKKRRR